MVTASSTYFVHSRKLSPGSEPIAVVAAGPKGLLKKCSSSREGKRGRGRWGHTF
jgi:hypothetical protein